jgi:serine-type D-Ala-D-Ala carboxypeptidase/endopeptidase (penicillin-binding protein 4)
VSFLRLGAQVLLGLALGTTWLPAQQAEIRKVDAEKGIEVSCRVERFDGSVVFDFKGEVPRVLASNTKLLTTAAALLELGPDYHWRTQALLDENRLFLVGSGDPSLRLLPDCDVKTQFLDGLALALREAGHTDLDGIILDDRVFDRVFRHPLWPEDQWAEVYSAPVGGMVIEGGCIELYGAEGAVKVVPALGAKVRFNRTDAANRKKFSAYWKIPDEVLKVTGGPQSLRQLRLAVQNPVRIFAYWLDVGLRARGIDPGPVMLVQASDPAAKGEILWTHESAWSVAEAVVVANKESDNFVTETLLKTIGAERSGKGSFEGGVQAIRDILHAEGLDLKSLNQSDGSGFARDSDHRANVASPAFLCALLRKMTAREVGGVYFDSLPIAEKHRRLGKYFKDPIFVPQRVHAKTGWITGASSLSGYLQAPDDTPLVFSIVVNYRKDYTPRTNNHRFRTLQSEILAQVLRSWTP